MDFRKTWVEQCDAALGIEDRFGVPQALEYLIGEKFLNFIEASDDHVELREEIPAFVAEIKTIFERYQLAEYLEIARRSAPFDPTIYEDEEDMEVVEDAWQDDLRKSAADLLLVERARGWLLED